MCVIEGRAQDFQVTASAARRTDEINICLAVGGINVAYEAGQDRRWPHGLAPSKGGIAPPRCEAKDLGRRLVRPAVIGRNVTGIDAQDVGDEHVGGITHVPARIMHESDIVD